MPKLHLRLEQLCACAADPGYHRLTNLAGLQCIHKTVLIMSTKLLKNHDELDVWNVLVAQAVV